MQNERLKNSKIKEYVLGFAFDPEKEGIILISKLRPEFQKGFLNGVGGSIEQGELPLDAMIREFKEETGIITNEKDWSLFSVMTCKFQESGKLMKVWNYRAFLDNERFINAKTMEEEEVLILKVGSQSLFELKLIENLKTLIPMAIDETFSYSMINLSYP